MPFTNLLNELDAEEAIPDELEDEADEAAEEDVGAEDPGPELPPKVELPLANTQPDDEDEWEWEDQYDTLSDLDLSDPVNVYVDATDDGEPAEGEAEWEIEVEYHRGDPTEAPNDRGDGTPTLDFEDGTAGPFTIGTGFGSGHDVELWGFIAWEMDFVEKIEATETDGLEWTGIRVQNIPEIE